MRISENLEITLSGLTWTEAILSVTPDNTEVQLAPGFANAPKDWKAQSEAMGLDPNQVILSAVHSLAYRHVKFVDGESKYFLKDTTEYLDTTYMPRGWHIITKSNIQEATWSSGDSVVTIRQSESDSELFDVIGKFPIEADGCCYGAYYETMMQPVHQADALREFETLATERKDEFYASMIKIIDATDIVTIPGFQDWDMPADPTPFKVIAEQFGMHAAEQEIIIYGQPVMALVFVAPSDEQWRDELDELVSEYPGVELEYEPLFWGVCRVA